MTHRRRWLILSHVSVILGNFRGHEIYCVTHSDSRIRYFGKPLWSRDLLCDLFRETSEVTRWWLIGRMTHRVSRMAISGISEVTRWWLIGEMTHRVSRMAISGISEVTRWWLIGRWLIWCHVRRDPWEFWEFVHRVIPGNVPECEVQVFPGFCIVCLKSVEFPG